MQGGCRAHAHAVEEYGTAGEKLGGFLRPEHKVISVQRAKAYVLALAFAVGAHVQVHEVVPLRFVEIVHRGKVPCRFGFIAVAEYHRDAGVRIAAKKICAKRKAVVRAYLKLLKGKSAKWRKIRNVVLPERGSGGREKGGALTARLGRGAVILPLYEYAHEAVANQPDYR